jgi:alkylated DNA repair dioxygenase AlkB
MLTYKKNWLRNNEVLFEKIINSLKFKEHKIEMYGRSIPMPRLISYHGDESYSYSGQIHKAEPWTKELLFIKSELENFSGYEFNSCLANLYRDGKDSVSPHSDDEKEIGPVIASVSLGEPRRFLIQIKDKSEPAQEFLLGNGDLIIMHEGIQMTHVHWIPKTKKKVGVRINLTFRQKKKLINEHI